MSRSTAVARRSQRIGAEESVTVNSWVISGNRDSSHGGKVTVWDTLVVDVTRSPSASTSAAEHASSSSSSSAMSCVMSSDGSLPCTYHHKRQQFSLDSTGYSAVPPLSQCYNNPKISHLSPCISVNNNCTAQKKPRYITTPTMLLLLTVFV